MIEEQPILNFKHKNTLLVTDCTQKRKDRTEMFLNPITDQKAIEDYFASVKITPKQCVAGDISTPVNFFAADDNLLIKGDNLLALHQLLKTHCGQVKCMYWDILYNTQSGSLSYNDSFDHNTWLVMMKNRLDIAKELLIEDGVILVQCDKNEDAYLKVLMDEIFGRSNFINSISIQSSFPSGNKTAHRYSTIIKTKDTLLVYKKNLPLKINPQYIERKEWDTHFNKFIEINENGEHSIRNLKDVLLEKTPLTADFKIDSKSLKNDYFYSFCREYKSNIFQTQAALPKDIKKISKKEKDKVIKYANANGKTEYAINGRRIHFLENNFKNIEGEEKLSMLLCDIWTDLSFNNTQNEGNVSLPSGKKPEKLVRRIIEMFTEPEDLVLDAYLGSGTTAAVAHKMGRRYIGIEQLDENFDLSLKRLESVIQGEQTGISKAVNWRGGGSFIHCELETLK